MKPILNKFALLAIVIAGLTTAYAQDPLPSWNDGPAKKSITEFVAKVTREGSPDFVAPEKRIATFDNDGTLWCEQPMYFQLLFALDRVKALAARHPEWKAKEPFASLLKGDVKGALAGGEHAMLEIIIVTHAGMTTAEFEKIVADLAPTNANTAAVNAPPMSPRALRRGIGEAEMRARSSIKWLMGSFLP